ncbi:S-layer homology domain-containing protein [Slackia piriformis]|nr:S-layer homology domain-containing protein [Slackia piriformis]
MGTSIRLSAILRRAFSCLLALVLAIGLMLAFPSQAQAAEQNDATAEARSYAGFSDVQPTDWYVVSGDLDYAVESGFLRGYDDGRFGPYDSVTRGQVATILWRMAGEPARGADAFWDVDYSQYYGKAILWASSNSVVNGYGDGSFRPDAPVTREELCAMLANFNERIAGYAVSSDCRALDRLNGSGSVSSWARESVGWAVDENIVSGEEIDGVAWVNPQGYAQRCAIAKMLSVEHRDVLGFSVGDVVGHQSGIMPTYSSGDKVVLEGYLEEIWWEQGLTGPQQSFILWLDDSANFNFETGRTYTFYSNVDKVQVYEMMYSLPDSVLNRRVRVAATVGTQIGSIWQRTEVILRDSTVVPID